LTACYGAEVVATIVEEAFSSLAAPVLRVAAPDAPYPISSLERDYLPSAERALGAIRRVMSAG
jgi:pyruvate dehydrogenase E1 component subunit beta